MKKTKYTGLLQSAPDPRDYRIQLAGSTVYPDKFMVSNDPPVYNQGEIGSCVMQALSSAPHAATGERMGVTFGYGYWRSHTMSGMYMPEALNGFVRDGIPPRSIDSVDLEVPDAIDYANKNKDRMLAAAEANKGWTYARVDTIEEIKAVVYGSRIRPGQRCIISLPYCGVSGGYWHTDGKYPYNHALAVVGWDDDEQAVVLRNSWGEDKGMFGNGTGYLFCKYKDVLATGRMYALIPPAKSEPTPDKPKEEEITVVRTLRLTSPYMRGDDVKHAQERLIVHGYNITADGIFGKKTYNAVREFQAAKKLTIDGIVGKNTLAALDKDPAVIPPAPTIDDELRADFIAYLYRQLGNIYCWGGNGEDATDYAIDVMENSAGNKRRAKAYLAKQKKAGVQNIKMYDCSGLISRWLQDHGIAKSKRNCNGLWEMCDPIEKGALQQLDWVYRGTSDNKTHVGVYLGRGLVIECKGRDEGVVVRGIDATDGYWQFFGRPKGIY